MTVQQLIEKLQNYNSNAVCFIKYSTDPIDLNDMHMIEDKVIELRIDDEYKVILNII